MTAIEIARRFAELGECARAQYAYAQVLQPDYEGTPLDRLEAACYLLQTGFEYKVPYTVLAQLYREGQLQEQILPILTEAFYLPNIKPQRTRYEKNCKLLADYPYLFRKDFVTFDQLPIRFYPFDDYGYLPLHTDTGELGEYRNFRKPVVEHYFFRELDKPIFATDVVSQYELEYLRDMVRPSEWVGRDNHIYLHYPDWGTFCAYLQCWNIKPLLEGQKFVFLIGDEVEQYPIDFKECFGLDYARYRVKPVGIREIHKIIWHTQLASHNGGDFFNEVLYGHPHLLTFESWMFDKAIEQIHKIKDKVREAIAQKQVVQLHDIVFLKKGERDEELQYYDEYIMDSLIGLKQVTDKDILVAIFLGNHRLSGHLDDSARIVPTILFQPHFSNISISWNVNKAGQIRLISDAYDQIQKSNIFKEFRYIKTFTPLRRITTSYAASVKFSLNYTKDEDQDGQEEGKEKIFTVVEDDLSRRVLNRTFMIDWQDRIYMDSRLVRFEDGKLNPKATFTALAEFLDIPYTHSMTYCSSVRGLNPESLPGNVTGFDPAAVYRTYDEYTNDTERYLIEYMTRDVYEEYGYDFHFYDQAPVDEERLKELSAGCTRIDGIIRETHRPAYAQGKKIDISSGEETDVAPEEVEELLDEKIEHQRKHRVIIAKLCANNPRFCNKSGQPLHFMTPLKLDPALLEQPLYR